MRILVTGAAGFLGWNLTRELRERHPEATIVGVDNLWTGVRRREEFVSEFVMTSAQHYMSASRFDYIYHMASPASPVKYQSDPLRTIKANVDGLWNCLGLMDEFGGTIFYASSSEVYGDPLVSPQPESYKGQVSCTGPRACYDESKRMCETIMLEWQRAHPQQRVKIARYFNVYGPGTLPDDGRAMSNFIWQAMNGEALTIYGDGKQTRCFTYVDDVIDATIRLVEETGDFTGPINIGTDVETTVRDIAVAVTTQVVEWQLSRGKTAWNIKAPIYLPAPVDDPRQRMPDLALAQRILGWRPNRLVRPWGYGGGIDRTIRHFETEYLREDTDNDAGADHQPEDTAQSA